MVVHSLELPELLEHGVPGGLLPPPAPNLALRQPLPRNLVEELLTGQRHSSLGMKKQRPSFQKEALNQPRRLSCSMIGRTYRLSNGTNDRTSTTRPRKDLPPEKAGRDRDSVAGSNASSVKRHGIHLQRLGSENVRTC
jgi:hypothetical protein